MVCTLANRQPTRRTANTAIVLCPVGTDSRPAPARQDIETSSGGYATNCLQKLNAGRAWQHVHGHATDGKPTASTLH
eukprot:1096467-Alexandrium_andersonii.AAC.1